ncbi:TPA: hypothetical protein GRR52_23695 [Vibrio parahaemolyticus]|nr:hypothetical protein [Vibrio parahaemolyticus]
MSTQEIGALIESVNNMTATVAGKMEEIDQKVDNATSAVPDKIKSQMDSKIYVDNVNGDDANDGLTKSQPKQSIKAAIDSVPRGSSLLVLLLGARVYEIENDVYCAGKLIIIESDGAVWGDPVTRSTIRSKQITNWGEYKGGQFQTGYGAEIHIHQVNLETVQFEVSKPGYNSYRNSLFSGSSSSAQVWMYGCGVTLNNGPLTHQHPNGSFGKIDLYLNSVVIVINETPTIADGKSVVIGHYGSDAVPFTLYVASTSLPAGKTWGDMVTANTAAANSNVSFS